jgi:hypothetical protein
MKIPPPGFFSVGTLGVIHAMQPDFGPNVTVFDLGMPTSQIQAAVDAIANQQVSNQFAPQRYALLFMPGTYDSAASPLDFQVGYYTEVAGLGASPTDVTINGYVDVYNQCLPPPTGCVAWLVQRRLEPGLLRCHGRASPVVPQPYLHDAGDQPVDQGEAVLVRRPVQPLQRLRPGTTS